MLNVYLISDFHDFDNDCHAHLYQLARHSEVMLYGVQDALEQQLQDLPQGLWVTDGRQQMALPRHSHIEGQGWQALLESCRKLAIPLQLLSTQASLWDQLFQPQPGAEGRRK